MARTEFTLWLMPREPLRSRLRELIRQLAAEYDAVEFDPHVTVYCGPSTEAESRAIASALAARNGTVDLETDRLDHTGNFTKTLFVQFRESVAARRLSDAARSASARPSDYAFDPHLSLLYKTVPEAERTALSRTSIAPAGTYAFDRFRVVETELPILDAGPIRRWRTVCDFELSGA